jgi:Sulfotransferase family
MIASAEAPGADLAPSPRVPDFFIVGHAKSGTTAMYEMLGRHPQIHMSRVKETWYFAPELRSPSRSRENPRHPDTLEGYLALFEGASPGQLLGEATPSYLFSHEAAGRIAALRPDARIIALLREPASFLRSLHLQFLKTDVETEKSLRRALELEDERRQGRALPRNSTRPQALRYSEHVRYVEQLRRYEQAFSREQLLVLIYEDFRADNEGTVREVLRFLELSDDLPVESVEVNPAVRIRSPRVHELVRSLYLGRSPAARLSKNAIKAVTPRGARRRALALQRRAQQGAPRAPDERLTLELRRRFRGEVEALGEYLDRDLLGFWGYDELD